MVYKNAIKTACLGAAIALLLPGFGRAASTYNFRTINNNGDPAFNQLLGINNAGTIAGYFGDGATVPNNGYIATPPYAQANFTAENYPGAAQTQPIGINNSGNIVGFFADTAGDNFGFSESGGTFRQARIPVTAGTTVNQLLGVNDHNISAGFYLDSAGTAHGFLYNLSNANLQLITPTGSTGSTAAGVNNAGDVTGFFTDAAGNTEGYYYNGTKFTEFQTPGSTNTMFFGLNNNGMVVGSYADANGINHGIVYNANSGTYVTVDDPMNSANAAFGVAGTFINGINDAGSLVGFYSDGTNVNGFLATVTPEPSSIGLVGLAAALGAGFFHRRKQRQV